MEEGTEVRTNSEIDPTQDSLSPPQPKEIRRRRKPLLREELWNGPGLKRDVDDVNDGGEGAEKKKDLVDITNYEEMTLAVIKDIQNLPNSRKMEIRQESGQRSYGPPVDWKGPPPPKGCEIFVGKLPRQVFEPQLIPIFEKAGPIYEFRMMIDFKGFNRGFCFVQYTKVEDAIKAIEDFNNYEIIPGRRIGVVKSVDNSRLFLQGIPLDKTEKEIFAEIETITEGVAKVQLGSVSSVQTDPTKNRGFAYIEYQTHKAACMARRKLVSSSIKMWGEEIRADWALDGFEKTLHVQNINPNSTPEDLKRIFNSVSQNGVEYVKIIRSYAFIHFISREHAINALIALEGQEVDGAMVRLKWAKRMNANNANGQNRNNGGNHNRKTSPSRSKERGPRFEVKTRARDNEEQRRWGSKHFNSAIPNKPLLRHVPVGQAGYNYPPNPDFSLRNWDPERELHFICMSQGLPEPVYLPIALRQGQSLYYGCKVVIAHSLCPREYHTQNFYCNIMDAKAAAAEGLLREMQGPMRPVLVAMPSQYGLHMVRGPRQVSHW